MSIVRTRLDRLERQIGVAHEPSLLIVAREGSDPEVLRALLAEKGIDPDNPRHTVVFIIRYMLEGDCAEKHYKAEILSITEQK